MKKIATVAVSTLLVLGPGAAVASADDDTDPGQGAENTNEPASQPADKPDEPKTDDSDEPKTDDSDESKTDDSQVVEPGVVSATEIEVHNTESAAPTTQATKSATPAKPATRATPATPGKPGRATPAIPAEPATPAIPAKPATTPAVNADVTPSSTPIEPPTDAVSEAPAANPTVESVTVKPVASPTPVPKAPVDALTTITNSVLGAVGLNPLSSPATPISPDSPAMWAMLAMARRRETEPSMFGRMFGDLAPLNQQTNEQLRLLAQGMLEGPAIANPKGTTGGVTFFGQFIDHDLTLDTSAQPNATVDPTTLVNGRTFAFDLDSVYGGGPSRSPQLYDGEKFKLGVATDGVSPDLPRITEGPNKGQAILIEARNDENLIIAQIHLSFLRLHNELIDQGMTFDEAHDTVVEGYRYVVLNDYLPQIVGEEAVRKALRTPVKQGFFTPGAGTPFTPVEFAVAAFRFGHSQVRNAYNINDASGGVPVFTFTPGVEDLRGGRQLPANLIIDFDNFFAELPQDGGPLLIGRAIDTQISLSLFQLPIPGAEGGGDNVLAFRNLLRAKFYDMPSGEAVATEMGFTPLPNPTFPEGTPLWFYILREAETVPNEDGLLGAELGPVGGSIVAEVFVDLLRSEGKHQRTPPRLPDISGGDFRIGDLLMAADQLHATMV